MCRGHVLLMLTQNPQGCECYVTDMLEETANLPVTMEQLRDHSCVVGHMGHSKDLKRFFLKLRRVLRCVKDRPCFT